MPHREPFTFHTEQRLVELTGTRAKNLEELREGVRSVSGSSVFYHTHHLYLERHIVRPQFFNHFALWVAGALHENVLAGRLSAIDLLSFTTIRQLRERILETLSDHLAAGAELRDCAPGSEFYFSRSKSFVMPTGIVARDVGDFVEKLQVVSDRSIYFHFLESRLRLGRPTNDFSFWLLGRGEEDLAIAIDRLDPYALTLRELRLAIVGLCHEHSGV